MVGVVEVEETSPCRGVLPQCHVAPTLTQQCSSATERVFFAKVGVVAVRRLIEEGNGPWLVWSKWRKPLRAVAVRAQNQHQHKHKSRNSEGTGRVSDEATVSHTERPDHTFHVSQVGDACWSIQQMSLVLHWTGRVSIWINLIFRPCDSTWKFQLPRIFKFPASCC